MCGGYLTEALVPQCLPAALQGHGLVWAARELVGLAKFSVLLRQPLPAQIWLKLAVHQGVGQDIAAAATDGVKAVKALVQHFAPGVRVPLLACLLSSSPLSLSQRKLLFGAVTRQHPATGPQLVFNFATAVFLSKTATLSSMQSDEEARCPVRLRRPRTGGGNCSGATCTCAGRDRCPATLKFLGRGHFRARMCGPTQALACLRAHTPTHADTHKHKRTLVSLKTFTGTSGAELEEWAAALLDVGHKRRNRDDALLKVLAFFNEHDPAAWKSLDEDVQACLVSDRLIEHEPTGNPSVRKFATPAKYKVPRVMWSMCVCIIYFAFTLSLFL